MSYQGAAIISEFITINGLDIIITPNAYTHVNSWDISITATDPKGLSITGNLVIEVTN